MPPFLRGGIPTVLSTSTGGGVPSLREGEKLGREHHTGTKNRPVHFVNCHARELYEVGRLGVLKVDSIQSSFDSLLSLTIRGICNNLKCGAAGKNHAFCWR